LTGKRLGGRGRGGSSGTWHAIAFDRRNPFVCVTTVILYYFKPCCSKSKPNCYISHKFWKWKFAHL